MKRLARLIIPMLTLLAPALGAAQLRDSSPAEQALDAEAFQGMDQAISERLPDVQAAVVLLRGRVVYAYHRDGQPDTLHDAQSVAKSALSALVGIALAEGRLASLDQPVLALMPEWTPLNADPRAAAITLRHLLTMTAGFAIDDPTGTAAPGRPQDAWARPLGSAPGQRFAYDNALVPVLAALLEKATGMPLADYARRELVAPLAMQEPSYRRGLHLRTEDMARLGQLFLQKGAWNGRALVPESYVMAATQPQTAGGPPASMPYGYLWWVLPTEAPRRTFMASGYGGQTIWVHPPLDLVIATSATASVESQRRGQAVQLLRTRLFAAAQKRYATVER
ncbi:serine hydrolase domain-containing protein [Variovorax ginsengisoli]|uniref:Serine hydrolase n=1 Tax=Variovorax ginsengisoli TaxID=363844 RepID=A0ABT8S9N7_9BURK|nr:serine hydrolase [Variovorax ginsengisoli]MDN8615988.1 serine hydrolase [Variovorax ginsengisoli]MDO1535158.1 serine hydrolase [Variovorax ginsengisoli]